MAAGLSVSIQEKRFGAGEPLFEDFALEVAPGSVVAVLGPSGVGKSTLVRMIAGIDPMFRGAVEIGGVAARQAPVPGLVFQDPRLLPWLSAVDNVRTIGPQVGRGEALAALELVGLGAYGDAYPHQLSGGMQRRVALARALTVNAGLLLLDEPFVSLDRELVAEMQELVGRLIADTGATALLVTHAAEDAARLADRAVVLAGRPARIVRDVAIEAPRDERDADVVAGYARLLAG